MLTKLMSDAFMTVGLSSLKVFDRRARMSSLKLPSVRRDPSPKSLYRPDSVSLPYVLEFRGEEPLLRAPLDDARDKLLKHEAMLLGVCTIAGLMSINPGQRISSGCKCLAAQ